MVRGWLVRSYLGVVSPSIEREDPLPDPGPPFRVGERVVLAPLTLGPTSKYIGRDELVITSVDPEAETFGFYVASDPERRPGGQGWESICRLTPNFIRWRTAWHEAFERSGDERLADEETASLWIRVVAEHPLYGHDIARS